MHSKGYWSVGFFVLSLAIVIHTAIGFRSHHEREPVVKGQGVTKTGRLSDYFSGLKNTAGDTDVFFLEGNQPGGTVVILAGVHSNEPSGMLSAVVFVENAVVKTGRVIVIPHANESGFTHNAPSEALPRRFTVKTQWGSRWFRFGDRLSNPVHQWPDPEVYVHYPSGELMADFDVRNLDRSFPGRPNGVFTEKVAFALTELVRKEKADMTVDLHEARPMNPIVNCIVAHERPKEIAAVAVMELEARKIRMRLEPSPKKMRGLSHRELGDHTQTLSMLMETANPIMDKLHGRVDETIILSGKDDFFLKAADRGLLYVPYPKSGISIEERVGRHLTALNVLMQVFSEFHPQKKIVVENLPEIDALKERGIGFFLRKPEEPAAS